jgi:hypothetical protein
MTAIAKAIPSCGEARQKSIDWWIAFSRTSFLGKFDPRSGQVLTSHCGSISLQTKTLKGFGGQPAITVNGTRLG